MFLRRAAVAAGLSVSLVGAGMGTAAAATDGPSSGDDPLGLRDTVNNTLSTVTGGSSSSPSPESSQSGGAGSEDGAASTTQSEDPSPSSQKSASHESTPASNDSDESGSNPASTLGDTVGKLQKNAPDVPSLGGKKGLLPGVCAGADLDGDAPCDGGLLGDNALEVCFESDAQIGGDLARQFEAQCKEAVEETPPPSGGGEHNPPPPESKPAPMPPPKHRAQPAQPAEPVVAQPSFTG